MASCGEPVPVPRLLRALGCVGLVVGLLPLGDALTRGAREIAGGCVPARLGQIGVPDAARRLTDDAAGGEVVRGIVAATTDRDLVAVWAWPPDEVWRRVFRRFRRLAAPRRVLPLEDPRFVDAVRRLDPPVVYGVFLTLDGLPEIEARLKPFLPTARGAVVLASGPGWRFLKLPLR